MKKIPVSIRVMSIVILVLIFSCEKQPFDFRNKYLGKWNFNISLSSWNPTRGGDYTDSYQCVGDFTTGVKFDELTLQSDYYSVTFRIDKYGTLISQFNTRSWNNGELGGFSGRNSFTYGYYHHQGAGPSWNSVKISGSRK
jgi:hypothetical protein